ncbi:MAG: sn-glycerol-3-phosphate ABC transporter permease UgpA [Bdellovibrionota bacterium]
MKRSLLNGRITPYLLLFPQLVITLIFFFYPAYEALFQSFMMSDPFGQKVNFVWFDNFKYLFASPEYIESAKITTIFSILTAITSVGLGLLFAALVDHIKSLKTTIQTLFIWPYAVAPAISGILWLFLFHPSFGAIGHSLNQLLADGWNPILDGADAMTLVIVAASWKQVSYNFVFFLSGLQSIPNNVIEAAAIDGAGPIRRFWKITIPLLSPTMFFLIVMNLVYAFFDTFGIIHTTTQGGPGGSTNILVYKVYTDGFVGLDLGGSAAQSVVLMTVAILLTYLQFRYVETKVQYA